MAQMEAAAISKSQEARFSPPVPDQDRIQGGHEDQQVIQTQDDIAGWRLAVIFLCLSVFLLLAFMDESIVATALVSIS